MSQMASVSKNESGKQRFKSAGGPPSADRRNEARVGSIGKKKTRHKNEARSGQP